MRIVVVDDEKAVLHGLRHIFAKHCPEHEIAGMAQSAQEALRLLRETKVDAVITDVKMHGMNGIDLTREIRRAYPDISVVILSGHADFDYVRQAMKDGAFDYLLKPCHYRTVIDMMQKIEEKAKERGQALEKQSRKEQLEKLLAGKGEMPEGSERHAGMLMAVVAGEGGEDPLPEASIERHIASWRFDGASPETVVREGECVVLFSGGADPATVKRHLQAYRQHMRTQNYKLYSSLYAVEPGARGIADAYAVCSRMNEFMRFNELSAEMDHDRFLKLLELQKGFAVGAYLSGKELGNYYAGADANKMRKYVEAALHRLYRLDLLLDPARLKRELLSELVYLEHMQKEHGSGLYAGRQSDIAQELHNASTLQALLAWLKKELMAIVMCMNDENRNPQYIQSAIRYIEMNYMSDLSLKTVADAVYLNPWYFSSQFKKHTNLSFSEYLNAVRVRIAKDFLRQKDLKVYQVAEMVGFQDAAYFSTVFKSIEHMSPKEFQKAF
ncbi:response regulator [Paenibacillus arenilitoris]|uniref:Response regulator n=1 Tax=Paenibacillus arenilitoris TaxID=2772299 RepID=A0A927CNF1_9BACL|nr:response regulator [Paenibacillus arenilitoris]MBD2869036.1 response regulator [Paenibacillus arenilitoris]